MKLVFSSLIVSRFGSFVKGKTTLSLCAFEPGLHFVRGFNKVEPRLGSNGSGKSTLFNALCWALTGKTTDGRRNPDIEPRFGERNTFVAVGIDVDKDRFLLTRTTHPNALQLGGDTIGQEAVDELTRLPFNVLTHTVLLGQGRPLFFDLTPERKMEVLGEVLNLDRWDERSEAASKETRELEKQEAGQVAKIRSLEDQEDRNTSTLTRSLEQWRAWKAEQDRRERETAEDLKRLKSDREARERDKAKFDLALDYAELELKSSRLAIKHLSTAIEYSGEKLADARNKNSLLRQQLTGAKAELKKFGNAKDCPTCGRPLQGTKVHEHVEELNKLIAKGESQLVTSSEKVAALESEVRTLQARRSNARDDEQKFDKAVAYNRSQLNLKTPEIARIVAEIKQLETTVKQKAKEVNPYTQQVDDLRAEGKALQKKLKEADGALKQMREKIERTRFWIKGFKEVRLYIIEEALQELELTTNAALADVGLIDWSVKYAIERETKSGTLKRGIVVSILSPDDKDPVRWECWSGGEAQRLRLIGALALSEVLLTKAGVEPNIEVLDEPTQHLSAEGVRDLCDYLADRAAELGRATFLIDHMSVESSRFSSTTVIVKDKDGSKIEGTYD